MRNSSAPVSCSPYRIFMRNMLSNYTATIDLFRGDYRVASYNMTVGDKAAFDSTNISGLRRLVPLKSPPIERVLMKMCDMNITQPSVEIKAIATPDNCRGR